MTTSDSAAECRTCGNSEAWHQVHAEIKHPFNDGSVPFKSTFGNRTPRDDRKAAQEASQGPKGPFLWPFDPVLRQALIDKGVLTPQDLTDAETKIRTVSAVFTQQVVSADGQR